MRLAKDSVEDAILTGLYLDTRALGTVCVAPTWRSERAIARAQAGADDVARRGVRLAYGRWFGRNPNPAERRTLSRALVRLEKAGHLVRHGRRRTTHVRLTGRGVALARAILETPDGEQLLWLPPEDSLDQADTEGAR